MLVFQGVHYIPTSCHPWRFFAFDLATKGRAQPVRALGVKPVGCGVADRSQVAVVSGKRTVFTEMVAQNIVNFVMQCYGFKVVDY